MYFNVTEKYYFDEKNKRTICVLKLHEDTKKKIQETIDGINKLLVNLPDGGMKKITDLYVPKQFKAISSCWKCDTYSKQTGMKIARESAYQKMNNYEFWFNHQIFKHIENLYKSYYKINSHFYNYKNPRFKIYLDNK